MNEMHVKCPHCGKEMDIELHGKPSSCAVFVCKECDSPLMLFEDGDVFELDREEFRKLCKKLAKTLATLRDNAERIAAALPEIKPEDIKPKEKPASKISQEDIDNLRIDLETCKDVSEFIDRL